MSILFEQHLNQSTPFKTKMFSEEAVEQADEEFTEADQYVWDAITEFAQGLSDDALTEESDLDLGTLFNDFTSFHELDEMTIEILSGCLLGVTEGFFEAAPTDDHIRAVLRVMRQDGDHSEAKNVGAPGKSQSATVHAYGGVPAGSEGIRRFMDDLKVWRHANYGGASNDRSFSAADVKVFDRQKANYGHAPDPNYNATKPANGDSPYPLQNPRLNVSVKEFLSSS